MQKLSSCIKKKKVKNDYNPKIKKVFKTNKGYDWKLENLESIQKKLFLF